MYESISGDNVVVFFLQSHEFGCVTVMFHACSTLCRDILESKETRESRDLKEIQ